MLYKRERDRERIEKEREIAEELFSTIDGFNQCAISVVHL